MLLLTGKPLHVSMLLSVSGLSARGTLKDNSRLACIFVRGHFGAAVAFNIERAVKHYLFLCVFVNPVDFSDLGHYAHFPFNVVAFRLGSPGLNITKSKFFCYFKLLEKVLRKS